MLIDWSVQNLNKSGSLSQLYEFWTHHGLRTYCPPHSLTAHADSHPQTVVGIAKTSFRSYPIVPARDQYAKGSNQPDTGIQRSFLGDRYWPRLCENSLTLLL